MKTLLIHSPAIFHDALGKIDSSDIGVIPVGLIAIANKLKEAGFQVEVLHLGIELVLDPSFKIEDYVNSNHFELIGISIHWHKQIKISLEIAHKIKKYCKDVFVVLGGFTASFFAKELMKEFNYLDAVIRGDGEFPLLVLARELASSIPRLQKVPNLVWKRKNILCINPHTYIATEEDLNNLNFWDYSAFRNYKTYIRNNISSGVFYVSNGRGCPYLCSFCGGGRIAQKKIFGRTRFTLQKPEKVLEIIVKAHQQGWKNFYFCVDPFPDTDYYQKLFGLIRKKKLKVSVVFAAWGLPTKQFIDSLVATFKKIWIEISPECFSEQVRKLNKGIFYSNQELENVLSYLAKKKIGVHLYFGYFLPFERFEDILKTLSYTLRLKDNFSPYLETFYIPYSTDPASPLYFHPAKFKMCLKVRNLSDYFSQIKIFNRRGIRENMLLHRPLYFTERQAKSIHHLIQLICYLDKYYPTIKIVLKTYFGSYLNFIQKAYSWIDKHPSRSYFITEKQVRNCLKNMIDKNVLL